MALKMATRHPSATVLLVVGLTSLAGCIVEPDDVATMDCQSDEPGPGDLQVHVVPRDEHVEHSDWDTATDKQATLTPFVDNATNRYAEDEARLPALTGPLDDSDCILFQDIPSGWWEIRASAQPQTTECSWYGGSGKMVLVEDDQATATRFQPSLAC